MSELNIIKVDENEKFKISKENDLEIFDIKNIKTENRIIYDYLTFVSKSDTIKTLIKLLGLEELAFIECKGWYGYSKQLYYDGIHFLYDGTPEMGICVEMSGQGCRNFEKYGTGDYMGIFSYVACNDDVRLTRLDVAYDDFTGVLNFKQLTDDIDKGNYLSRFREFEFRRVSSKNVENRSYTIYCGSHKSDIMFRIYDKRAEQKAFEIDHWLRFEIQMRKDRANVFSQMLLGGNNMPDLFAGVVKNYLRFIEPSSDTNLSRAKTASYWSDFLGTVEKISLFVADLDYSESRLERFVKSQCSSAIVSFISLFGFRALIDLILGKATCKLNNRHSSLISAKHIDNVRQLIANQIDDFQQHKNYQKLVDMIINSNDLDNLKSNLISDTYKRPDFYNVNWSM